MKKKGRIFVISAPSGCGKTTICKKIVKITKNLIRSVSATTRRPRPGEKNKKDYYYVSERYFRDEIKKGHFLEWERNFNYLYGTPKQFVSKNLKKGKNVLLSIDVKGAMAVRKKFPNSVLIFITPPSLKELLRRLKTRKTDKNKEINERMKVAKKELKAMKRYDYTIVNDNLSDAVNRVATIIKNKIEKGE